MGTYIGNEGGPYLFLSREPLACAAGKKNKYLVKVQASHFLIDTSAKTYGSLLSPDRALEYGDYPATAGKSDSFLTYATVRNSRGYTRDGHCTPILSLSLEGLKRRQQGNKRVVIVSTARRAAAS